MNDITFYYNDNGRLMQETFTEVLSYRPTIGTEYKAFYKSLLLGKVSVQHTTPIHFCNINDNVTYMAFGRNAQWIRTILSRMMGRKGIQANTLFYLVTFSYEKKNMATHEELLKLWWEAEQDKHGHIIHQQSQNY